jgi:hypothetical protein
MRMISQSPDPLARMHTMTERKGNSGTIPLQPFMSPCALMRRVFCALPPGLGMRRALAALGLQPPAAGSRSIASHLSRQTSIRLDRNNCAARISLDHRNTLQRGTR